MAWTQKYPNGCIQCGTTEKKHLGRGLCTTCYQREARENEAPTKILATDGGDLSTDDGDAVNYDRDTHVSNEEIRPGMTETPPTFSERRPGDAAGFSSVPGDPADVPNPRKGLRAMFAKKEKPTEPTPPKPSKETRPGKTSRLGRRNSTADTLEDILSAAGGLAVRTGKHQPLGRYLQFSSPVSAEILDEAISGTIIDRVVLQPLVKGRGKFDGIAAVLGPPAIILAIENNPERAAALFPLLKTSIRNSLPMMAKAIKKVQAKERAMAEAAAELFPDLPEGEDPADAILAMIFDGWTPATPSPSEAPPVETNQPEEQETAA
jgi:hypothetical protein